MDTFSSVQNSTAEAVCRGENVAVIAVAGAGKTSTCKCITASFKKRVLLLLYNNDLARETRKKFQNVNANIEIRTCHSFVGDFYNTECSTDEGLYKVTTQNILPRKKEQFFLIVIDECQDLTPLLFQIIMKIIQDFEIPQIVLLGDPRQCIYKFRDSTEKYLLNPEYYFDRKFTTFYMNTSYRCPRSHTKFVSNLGISMNSLQKDGRLKYIVNSKQKIKTFIIDTVLNFVENGNYFSDIVILSYTLKNSMVNDIANYMTFCKIPINFLSDEKKTSSEKLLFNKITFSTFHSFKGRERKLVIVLNLDERMIKYMNVNSISNEMYVAFTRSTNSLVLCREYSKKGISYIDDYFGIDDSDVEFDTTLYTLDQDNKNVTEIIKNLSPEASIEIKKLFSVTETQEPVLKTCPKGICKFEKTFEDVSGLMGNLITLYKLYKIRPKKILREISSTFQTISDTFSPIQNKLTEYIYEAFEYLANNQILEYICYYINILNCFKRNLIFPLYQISHYDWIPKKRIEKCLLFLSELKKGDNFEVSYLLELENLKIWGRADYVSKKCVYEVKFVKNLNESHFIQTALYIVMDYNSSGKLKTGKCINAMNGNVYKILVEKENVLKIIELLKRTKK